MEMVRRWINHLKFNEIDTLTNHSKNRVMIILGSITAFTGVFSFFFLIDNPKSPALNLNAEQEILVEERTRDNATVRTTTIKTGQIMEAIRELRFWCKKALLLMNLNEICLTDNFLYSNRLFFLLSTYQSSKWRNDYL